MVDFALPTEKEPPIRVNPKTLGFYGFHKIGKTEILNQLENNLILDFEEGTDEKTSLRLKIIGITPPTNENDEQKITRYNKKRYYIKEVISKLKQNNPYKYISIDTTTSYEDQCMFDATKNYMRSPIGKNFNRWDEKDHELNPNRTVGVVKPYDLWETVTNLPKGAGWFWVREAFEAPIVELQKLESNLILCSHVKLSSLSGKGGKTDTEVNVKEVSLTGKNKDMTTQILCGSVGYMYREGNKNFISFQPSDEVRCGSRSKHLANKEILISEQLEDGTIKTYWENIYI